MCESWWGSGPMRAFDARALTNDPVPPPLAAVAEWGPRAGTGAEPPASSPTMIRKLVETLNSSTRPDVGRLCCEGGKLSCVPEREISALGPAPPVAGTLLTARMDAVALDGEPSVTPPPLHAMSCQARACERGRSQAG